MTEEGNYFVVVCFCLFRSEFLRGFSFEQGVYHEDAYFSLAYLMGHAQLMSIHISDKLYNYRIAREGSITSTITEKHIRDWVYGLGKVYECYERKSSKTIRAWGNAFVFAKLLDKYREVERLGLLAELRVDEHYAPLLKKVQRRPLPWASFLHVDRCLFGLSPQLYSRVGRYYQAALRRLKLGRFE